VKHPEGVLEYQKRRSLERVNRIFERRHGQPTNLAAPQPAGEVGALRE
jgi:hypothetical protein